MFCTFVKTFKSEVKVGSNTGQRVIFVVRFAVKKPVEHFLRTGDYPANCFAPQVAYDGTPQTL